MLFLHADYMTDKLTIHDACYKFHLNFHRQQHSKDMTKQQTHKQHPEKRGHPVCAYTQAHTHMDANGLKDFVQYMGVDK